jgi:heme/copper-type cytochrome/quinol oxidase subunit 4
MVGLFRPFLWEADNIWQALVGFENLMILLAAGLALWACTRGKARSRPHFILLLGVIHYVMILAVLLSLAAPNFGEISRYKISFLPFFVYILLLALHPGNPEAVRE